MFRKRNEQIRKVQDVCKRFVFVSKVNRKLKVLNSCLRAFRLTGKFADKFKRALERQVFATLSKIVQSYKD